MQLGPAIKKIRRHVGMTQTELSQKTGISQTSLSKIEGGAKPGEANLKKICLALDVPTTLVYMMAMSEEEIPKNKKAKYRLLFPVIMNLAMEIIGKEHRVLFSKNES